MPANLEREIKLRFPSPEEARAAVLAIGAIPLRRRRLQDDFLLDTLESTLGSRRSALRVRFEAGTCLLTFKGPAHAALMKVRDELETSVGDGELLLAILERLGFHLWFRSQKYREELALADCIVAIDETPLGTFVEIEGDERGITDAAAALGRGPADYVLESYRTLYSDHCRQHGRAVTHMLFES
jgi:adenylate cyclase class 2